MCKCHLPDVHISFLIALDICYKEIVVGGESVKIELWDTPGQDRHAAVVKTHFKGKDGVLVVYDCTDPSSFEKLDFWLEMIAN